MDTQTKRLYRVPELCEILRLSKSSIYREIEAGNLRAIRIGKSVRVSAAELDRYLETLEARMPVA